MRGFVGAGWRKAGSRGDGDKVWRAPGSEVLVYDAERGAEGSRQEGGDRR